MRANDPLLRTSLQRWPGRAYLQSRPDGVWLTLVRRAAPRPRERWWLHALLALATLLTTTLAGAVLAGSWAPAFRDVSMLGVELPLPVGSAAGLLPGLWFSLPLVAILLAHELGHYLLARYHGLDVSPPWLIPAPPVVNLIGTFGAFIRLRSPLVNRAVLLDVGAAGPAASFVLSIPACAAGLLLSTHRAAPPGYGGPRLGVVLADDSFFALGSSPIFGLLAGVLAPPLPGAVLALHPLAVAGWFGFFFTMLNLFPASQLDGGHVAYALSGPRGHRAASLLCLAALLALGWVWPGWWVWGALVLILGRGRLRHPPVAEPGFRLTGWRRVLAWACLLGLGLSFVPVPA
ncbi:MAG TPA: site-2 protease family protein [Longimicrobiaceae bacterium]|nr:site-2 protease family protein [Longimicrobiaceae bacterium]